MSEQDRIEQNRTPQIEWIKNDPGKHQVFGDGSTFLVALQVGPTGGPYKWDFDVVKANCDGESMYLEDREGNAYSTWDWSDFEFFALLEGEIPQPEYGAV
jgi:hypothetical protein